MVQREITWKRREDFIITRGFGMFPPFVPCLNPLLWAPMIFSSSKIRNLGKGLKFCFYRFPLFSRTLNQSSRKRNNSSPPSRTLSLVPRARELGVAQISRTRTWLSRKLIQQNGCNFLRHLLAHAKHDLAQANELQPLSPIFMIFFPPCFAYDLYFK